MAEKTQTTKIIATNRDAYHNYHILETYEAGIQLTGTEVKSARAGRVNLKDAYAKIERDEVWLVGCEIPEYPFGNRLNHKPKRTRKLLIRRSEINKFAGKASQRGFTLVPLRLYFKNGKAKVEIAVARGKQHHDKRESLKKAEAKREMDRATARRRKG